MSMKARLPIRSIPLDHDDESVEQRLDATEEYRIFATVLAGFRKERLTQTEFGRRIGRSQVFVVKLEQAVRKVDVIELLAMLKILKVDLGTFMKVYRKALRGARAVSRLRNTRQTPQKPARATLTRRPRR